MLSTRVWCLPDLAVAKCNSVYNTYSMQSAHYGQMDLSWAL